MSLQLGVPVRPLALVRALRRSRCCFKCESSRGFGNVTKKVKVDDVDSSAASRKKGKASRTAPPQPPSQPTPVQLLNPDAVIPQDDEDFLSRLSALKERSRAPAGVSGNGNSLPDTALQSEGSIYDAPPPLMDNLMGGLNYNVSDPSLKAANIGPNQVAIAVSALVLGVLFLISTGIDLSNTRRSRGAAPSAPPPSEIQQKNLKDFISELEASYKETPEDFTTVKQLAIAYAQNYEFKKSAQLLEVLVKTNPSADNFRLLGETTLLLKEPQRSVQAYLKAIALAPKDFTLLSAFANACGASHEEATAIKFFDALVLKLKAQPSEASGPGAALALGDSQGSMTVGPAAQGDSNPVQETSSQGGPVTPLVSGVANAETADDSDLDPVLVTLLKANVYAKWSGHVSDALATYDALVQEYPTDYRGYLYKGRFLKDQGQRTAADRMFLQAKFYAPENRQALVQRVSSRDPIIDVRV